MASDPTVRHEGAAPPIPPMANGHTAADDEAPIALDFGDTADDWHPELSDMPEARVRIRARTFMCTDTGNAERFAAMHAESARYCPAMGKWLLWDGTRWAIDSRGAVFAMVKQTVRAIYAEAAQCDDDDKRKAVAAWAAKSESRGAREAMLALAQSEPGIAVLPEELDRDPWLLNTPTCTVDLRTGVPRAHDRADLITKRTAAAFDGAAKSDLWDRVLSEAMPDPDLRAFFLRAAGYSCTGLTTEEKLFLPIGDPATGKSTLIQAIIAALGDYAKTADFEAFLDKRTPGGPKNEIARLAGARFVASIEVDKGKRLAQGLVKTLTGGDVVSARFLFHEAFEFLPTFCLWLVANDAPGVADDDGGMWRRILRIPFLHVVPPEKRDPKVKAELVDPTRGGPAVLASLVVGCLQWQAKGLGIPPAVREATAEYRADEDPVAGFIVDCCAVHPGMSVSRRDLRGAYERWVDEAGGRTPLTGHEFNARVRKVDGVGEKVVRGVRWWTGIGLLTGDAGCSGAGGCT
jgi:putative DNA primase/helicase